MDDLFAQQLGRVLQLSSGVFWTIAYVLMIYKSFQDRRPSIPLAALCANLTWQTIFTFIYPIDDLQMLINLVWLALNFMIMLQYLAYTTHRKHKTIRLLLSLAAAFLIHLSFTGEFQDLQGKYLAFGMNFMMSLLFIVMLRQQGTLGQSVGIGVMKFLGSMCAAIIFYYLFPDSPLLLVLYVFIIILDLTYIIMLKRQKRRDVGYMFRK
ncbi:transmembrane-type terpene cyclase [Paenibacillus roseipurpureus]|uniref:Uncharacterized protein n=1 Tax=Paenibacillus roseopurpureus TaxID=2918901 RepID=A0AA96LRT0_9BACL|nr:hypothetical protein [Paenibacillus sp. MBLB1832]WNR44874.1 hypothetical protein MJB10_01605 [Paenibacillus sp. MBLB1832]